MCRKGGRRCPSSKKTGAALDAHNAHRRELYAENKKLDATAKDLKITKKNLKEVPIKNLAKEIKSSKNETAPTVIPGRISEDTEITRQHAQYQEATNALISYLRKPDGSIHIPHGEDTEDYDSDEEYLRMTLGKKDETGTPEFRHIGEGVDKNVYLHAKTNLVFKIINVSDDNRENMDEYLDTYIKNEQYLIAQYDDEFLARHNIRYAKNYFLQSEGVPVIAQEYLSPEEYEPYDLYEFHPDNPDSLKTGVELAKKGFVDFHEGNVMKNKETGEIVLFDCLQVGYHTDQEEREEIRQNILNK